ncbi:retropepsin-like aspartic protease [Armatimonas sp.]|uniref:retropepsin-like aspartic protease n=1 Tax=Armatimonas sp. TaxID=1872638 RepID=UPI00286D6800|nr:retropepsin-like aspartic protease [Armatimonas sp.]
MPRFSLTQQTTEAATLFTQNRFAEAVAAARASGQSVILIRALLRLDRWDEALAAAEDAVRLAPEDIDLQGLLALAQLRGGRSDEALTNARAARKRSPENYFALLAEATLLVKWLGDQKSALPLARQLVALRPDLPESWWVLVEALEDIKETLAAVARLRALKPQGHPFEETLDTYRQPEKMLEYYTRLRELRKRPNPTEFPETLRLPFSRQKAMVFITVAVNGKDFKLLFDTGASDNLALNPDAIQKIKPSYLGEMPLQGVTGTEVTRDFVADSVRIGKLNFGWLPLTEVRKDPKDFPYRYDGLFGAGLLSRYSVTLDFGRNELVLRRSEKNGSLASLPPLRKAAGPVTTYSLPLHISQGRVLTHLELLAPHHKTDAAPALSCPLWAEIDTGSSITLISQRIAKALAYSLPKESVHSKTTEFLGGIGTSQTKMEITAVARPLQLSSPEGLGHSMDFAVGASPLDRVLSPHSGFERGAILGMPFLQQYRRVTFDYPNKQLILETDVPHKPFNMAAEKVLMSPINEPSLLKEKYPELSNHRRVFYGNQWVAIPKGMAIAPKGVRKVTPFKIAPGFIGIFDPESEKHSSRWLLLPEASRALPDGKWEIG